MLSLCSAFAWRVEIKQVEIKSPSKSFSSFNIHKLWFNEAENFHFVQNPEKNRRLVLVSSISYWFLFQISLSGHCSYSCSHRRFKFPSMCLKYPWKMGFGWKIAFGLTTWITTADKFGHLHSGKVFIDDETFTLISIKNTRKVTTLELFLCLNVWRLSPAVVSLVWCCVIQVINGSHLWRKQQQWTQVNLTSTWNPATHRSGQNQCFLGDVKVNPNFCCRC